MTIAKDKVVSVIYELMIANNEAEIIEKVSEQNPLTFLLGYGNLLPKFESNLFGLQVGDAFDFVINSQEAYGKISKDVIIKLPKSVFKTDDKVDESLLNIGNIVPMMDQSGNKFNGKVIEVIDNMVTMDFNHPLAGEDLHFKGQVIDVREATQEELTHGHIHGTNNCASCNSCESDCDKGCN